MPWRPRMLWDVEASTFSRQSAHRWPRGCQPYASAALYLRKIPGTNFCQRLSRPQGHSAAERIRSIEKTNELIRNRTQNLSACSVMPKPTTLLRVLIVRIVYSILKYGIQGIDTLSFVLRSSECKSRVVWEVFTNVSDKTCCLSLHSKVYGIITGRSEISTADETSDLTHCFTSSLFFQQLLFF
jgi:hypothetical protein